MDPSNVSQAEFFKTDEMSREEYLTWTVEQPEYCLSLDGYKSEEIKAKYVNVKQNMTS